MIDIADTLSRYNVPTITSGPNVKRGEINICCPWCGDDPSFHLGINPETGYWACWRDRDHRGKSLRRLLRKLCGMSDAQLDALLGARKITPVDEMLKVFHSLGKPSAEPGPPSEVKWPAGFVPICDTTGPRGSVWDYLCGRGYTAKQASELVELYDLRCCSTGVFSHRVIFPLTLNKKLVGWTGRDTTGRSETRYRTEDHGRGKVLVYATRLRTPHLVIVEGPFDALRLNYAAWRENLPIRALAVLGTAVIGGQINLLFRILPKPLPRMHVAFDASATATGHKLLADLAPFHPSPLYLPQGPEDPGAMNHKQAVNLLEAALGA